ncbi:hypothetical protein M9194_00870 [Vibrio sp. S4M6]|uniref:hypothetical protein n=1 Tax=Vibrio sinus TaxID=2946865 RepID=UPI00202A2992|nr:hypothetical protein [Vibrio sinus]MCL9779980.1 hypothetical protein [Vibrio sinus]
MLKKISILTMAVMGILSTQVYASNNPESAKNIADWRKTGTPEEQLKALVKVTPGTHHWMPEIAYRYQSFYWAAKQEKWDFAKYQIESMEKMMSRVGNARPKREPTAQKFSQAVFPVAYRAIESKQWAKVQQATSIMAGQCNACHAVNNYPYIVIPPVPTKPNSVVLGYPE